MSNVACIEISDVEIPNLAKLASEIWHEYWVGKISDEQIDYMLEKFQSVAAISEQIKNENYTYFFIKCNSEIAGYVALSKKEDYLFLSKIYIKKEFRRIGIGAWAFEFVKKFALDNNYKNVRLTVNKYNINSINAYKKWGFRIVDAIVTDIGGGFVMDDYVMEYCFIN